MKILEELRAGVVTTSAAETQALATRFAAAMPADTILALHGDLGVGKTTFVQGLARGLGITGSVTSPTFTLYTVHRAGGTTDKAGQNRTLVHLDAYRLENTAQLDTLMLDDFLVSPYCLAIEWPDHIAAWLPADTWHLDLGIEPGERPEPAHRIVLRPG